MPNFAAIDIGSNALRMVVGHAHPGGKAQVLENLRLPVRLGQDAFTTRHFSEETMQLTVEAFRHFRKMARSFGVEQERAVATSAMRETNNSSILIDRIASDSGFKIEVIDGDEEARLIYLAVAQAVNIKGKNALLIDIGGGSVEVTLANGETMISSKSYNMGTVRLLRQLGTGCLGASSFYHLARKQAASVRNQLEQQKIEVCIGTGGNVEELGKLRKRIFRRERSDMIAIGELENLAERLGELNVSERAKKFSLNPNRADVILPACVVLHLIAAQANVKNILIPGVGLKDGILIDMVHMEMA